MSAREIILCHPVRTAIGAYNGSLKSVPATELGAVVVRETLRRAGIAAAAWSCSPDRRCFLPRARGLSTACSCECRRGDE
jgi:acetyl-CoA acetyltransferase